LKKNLQYEDRISMSADLLKLNFNGLTDGIYCIEILDGETEAAKKITKSSIVNE
jgi:hypothetical protein